MIITYALQFIQYILINIIELLPVAQSVPDVSGAISHILAYAYGWNWILPVYEAVTLIQWTFYIYSVLIVWFILKWVFSGIPFLGRIVPTIKAPDDTISYIGSDQKWHHVKK